jgi:hypothetical protein
MSEQQEEIMMNKFMRLTFFEEGFLIRNKPFLRNHLRQGKK